jgi:acyl-CoA synthetase (NDP forming)
MPEQAQSSSRAPTEKHMEEISRLFGDAASEGRETVSAAELMQLLTGKKPASSDHLFSLEVRNTREFGSIISAGPGGADADLYAEFPGTARVSATASVELTGAAAFLELFRQSLAYRKGAGMSDEQLINLFEIFIGLSRFYSPVNPDAPFVIETLVLDGECRFRHQPTPTPTPKPIRKIGKLLHPTSIGIVGVSGTKMNFGRIILRNIIASGYDKTKLLIIKPGDDDEIDGVRCVPNLAALDHKLDLFIVAVGAAAVFGIVDEVIDTDAAESVMLIPGGLGETEASREPVSAMTARINAAHEQEGGGPVFLGGNCLGIVSHPGNYDSWFIPVERLPRLQKREQRHAAMISQSGAFMITRLSKNAWLDPAYMIAVGNQNDLTHGDMLSYFVDRDEIGVIGFYIEGFRDLDGLAFATAVRKAVTRGKQVVVYKAGQSAAGQGATMGHTASIAGDYGLCVDVLTQAGAMIADSFGEFSDLFYIASTLHAKTINGNRLAAISGAGFETVGIADSIVTGGHAMVMAGIEDETINNLSTILREKRLDALMEVRNPFDINPGADDEAHVRCAEVFANDPNVDAVIVGLDPLSPVTRTLEKSAREGYDIHSEESHSRQN